MDARKKGHVVQSLEESSSTGLDPEIERSGSQMSGSGNTSKSYVNMLEDVCHAWKVTPTYQLISMEGMSHEPTFVYKVQIEGQEPAMGRGRRKQDARQLAAKNLLLNLGMLPADEESPVPPVEAHPISETVTKLAVSFATAINLHAHHDDKPPAVPTTTTKYPLPACRTENPVGSLQELTLSIRWPPPRFEVSAREGQAHDATFTMACYVWSYKSLGKGKSKKLAKRQAAQAMFDLLRASPEVAELWQKRAEAYAAKTAHQRRNKPAVVPQRAPAMQNVHRDLYTGKQATLAALRQIPQEKIAAGQLPDPLGVLQEIATELSFDILFEDLYDLTKPGKASKITAPPVGGLEEQSVSSAASLVILTIPRQIVCFGSGDSKAVARKAAVLNALLYLKTAAAPPFGVVEKPMEEV